MIVKACKLFENVLLSGSVRVCATETILYCECVCDCDLALVPTSCISFLFQQYGTPSIFKYTYIHIYIYVCTVLAEIGLGLRQQLFILITNNAVGSTSGMAITGFLWENARERERRGGVSGDPPASLFETRIAKMIWTHSICENVCVRVCGRSSRCCMKKCLTLSRAFRLLYNLACNYFHYLWLVALCT